MLHLSPHKNTIYCTESLYYLSFWCFYYFTLSDADNVLVKYVYRLPEDKLIEGKSRVISSTHAIILSFFSFLYLNEIIGYEYWTSFLPVCASFGMFDMLLVTINYSIFKKGYTPIIIHHSMLVFGPLLVTPEISHVMAQAFLFEVTVPILDFNWYLYHTEQKDTIMFKVNSLASILSFFFFRIANSCYLLTQCLQYNLKIQCVAFSFLFLNIHWFLNLVKLFIRQS